MAGFIFEKYTMLIMDGSNPKVVDNVLKVVNGLTRARYGEATCRDFDEKHTTMKVVETKTSFRIYNDIQAVLEALYPGLCVFYPEK